jgi:hypothetical protein
MYIKFRDTELVFEVNQQKAHGVSKYLTDQSEITFAFYKNV